MKNTLVTMMTVLAAGTALAQVTIPDGTRVRVRLETTLNSSTAEEGMPVDFVVSEEVRVGDAIVIGNGARATGAVTLAEGKGRMGRAGKLDFSVDRVMTVEGNWLRLRYTPVKTHGKGNGVRTGIITAGVAVVFWPAAPLALLSKGKDVTIHRGRTFDVFSDETHYVASAAGAGTPAVARVLPGAPVTMMRAANGGSVNNNGLANNVSTVQNASLVGNQAVMGGAAANTAIPLMAGNAAQLTVTSAAAGADIEIDGAFVGSAPSTLMIPAGVHRVTVRAGGQVWEREMQVTGGQVTLHAAFAGAPIRRTAR
jgi:hypothetical protein